LALALFFILFPSAVAAQDESPLAWDAAVREAVAWHPSVSEAIARLNSRTEDVEVAEAGYRPQISGGVGSSYNNVAGSGWKPRANLSASQMLFDFGKVKSAVAAAEAGTRIGRSGLLLAVDSLIRDTSFAVIEIQRSMMLERVAHDQLASISDISRLVHDRYDVGASTKSDALQAQARVQAAEITMQEIESERRRWQSNLAYLLGRSSAPPVSLDPPVGLYGACDHGEPDWTSVPAIMQVRAERDEAHAQLDRSRADGMPTISLGAGGGADLTDPFSRRAEYNVGINVSAPLYSGGARRARARSAAYALTAADAAEARVRNEVGRQLAEAQRQAESLRGVLDTLGERQTSMTETGRLYRLQYVDMGTRSLVDLLNAEQELHQVRFDFVNTRFDIRRLEVTCLFHTGVQRDLYGLTGQTIRGVTL
jgi:adhesin transport system outer membrane protein